MTLALTVTLSPQPRPRPNRQVLEIYWRSALQGLPEHAHARECFRSNRLSGRAFTLPAFKQSVEHSPPPNQGM